MIRASTMRVKFLLAVTTLLTKHLAEASDKTVNAPEYMALCRIYRMAKAGESLQEEAWVKEKLGELGTSKILGEVEQFFTKLNISEESKSIVDLDGQVRKGERLYITKRGAGKIGRVVTKMRQLETRVQDLQSVASENVKAAKASFSSAIRGPWSEETAPTSSLSSARTTECKKDGGKAGTNLIIDMTCLCATSTNTNDYLCGFQAETGATSPWQTNNGEANFNNNWNKIKTDCNKHTSPPVTPWDINQTLNIFESLIGRHAAEDDDADGTTRYIFGKPHTGGECGSANADTGCVNYGGSDPKGAKRDSTAWETALYSAGRELGQADEAFGQVRKLTIRMEQLRDIAETIFNETVIEAESAGLQLGEAAKIKPDGETTKTTKHSQVSSDSTLAQSKTHNSQGVGPVTFMLSLSSLV